MRVCCTPNFYTSVKPCNKFNNMYTYQLLHIIIIGCLKVLWTYYKLLFGRRSKAVLKNVPWMKLLMFIVVKTIFQSMEDDLHAMH